MNTISKVLVTILYISNDKTIGTLMQLVEKGTTRKTGPGIRRPWLTYTKCTLYGVVYRSDLLYNGPLPHALQRVKTKVRWGDWRRGEF